MADTNNMENTEIKSEPLPFDKLRLYTWADADQIKIGSKGYLSDSVQDICRTLDPDYLHKLLEMEITQIYPKKYSNRFGAYNGYSIAKKFFYLLDDPVLRPYTVDELFEWWTTSNKKVLMSATMEEFWLKSFYYDKGYYMVFVINNGGETHRCTIPAFCDTFLKPDMSTFFMPIEEEEGDNNNNNNNKDSNNDKEESNSDSDAEPC